MKCNNTIFQKKTRAKQHLPVCILMVGNKGRLVAESLRGEVRRWRALLLHNCVGGRQRRWWWRQWRRRGRQLLIRCYGMLHCPLSLSPVFSDHDYIDLLRRSRSRVGGGKGRGRASEEGVALWAGGSLMGVNLWASGRWERLLWRGTLAPGPKLALGVAFLLVRSRQGPLVGDGRGRSLPALGICSGRGRSCWEALQRVHVGLFSPSVREPKEQQWEAFNYKVSWRRAAGRTTICSSVK